MAYTATMPNYDIDPRYRAVIDRMIPLLPPPPPCQHRKLPYQRTALAWIVRALMFSGVKHYDAIWAVVIHLDLPDPAAATCMLHVVLYQIRKLPWPPGMLEHLDITENYVI